MHVRPSPLRQSSLPYLDDTASLQSVEMDEILAYYVDTFRPTPSERSPGLRLNMRAGATAVGPALASPGFDAATPLNFSRPLRSPPSVPGGFAQAQAQARAQAQTPVRPPEPPAKGALGPTVATASSSSLSPSPSPPLLPPMPPPQAAPAAAPIIAPRSSSMALRVTATHEALAALPGISRAIANEPQPVLAAYVVRGRVEGEGLGQALTRAWDEACRRGAWKDFEPLLQAATDALLLHARSVLQRPNVETTRAITGLKFRRTLGRSRAPYIQVTFAGGKTPVPLAASALQSLERGALSGAMCLILQRYYHHLASLVDRAPLEAGIAPDSRRGRSLSNTYMQLRGEWITHANALGTRARLLRPKAAAP